MIDGIWVDQFDLDGFYMGLEFEFWVCKNGRDSKSVGEFWIQFLEVIKLIYWLAKVIIRIGAILAL